MEFVELHRYFVPIGTDKEPIPDTEWLWGYRIAGWLTWPTLLKYRRVVLLAEALSGKTEEFRHQAAKLFAEGKPAFFMRIEELADGPFDDALDPAAVETFEAWDKGNDAGWFFLDSVDEARLNRKNFESALKRFRRKLDRSLERARVFISCRASDWKVRDDRISIEQQLPVWEAPASQQAKSDENRALLAPIFEPKQAKTSYPPPLEPERKANDLLIVQLVPLSDEQRCALATATGIHDADDFNAAIDQNGLERFAERPGDLLHLAEYWKHNGRFDSLSQMTEHGITRKLAERDLYRPDNVTLSPEKAREGAERLAATLTLGKSFTLCAPGQDADPSLASSALDPASILDDWTSAERNALLRRGIFAPSTYGRIRFHHRSTQEYLTAKWFERLLRAGCPRTEIWHLIFADPYGVETVVPSLRPAAAWLAIEYPEFRNEMIRREPLVLLRHGDPKVLPLEQRKQLLRIYAAKHAHGEITDDSFERKYLWMFSDAGLADSIHEAWHINPRDDFKIDLLQLIGEGAITGCVDLARNVVRDEGADNFVRMWALKALKQCEDRKGLGESAKQLMADPSRANARIASSFAQLLYPHLMTTAELLTLIQQSQPASEASTNGFPYAIVDLYKACPTAAGRDQLISGLAELCLTPPYVADYSRVAERYSKLAGRLTSIARSEIERLGNQGPPRHLIRLLMVIERAESELSPNNEPPLTDLVQANSKLNRQLFWADVEDEREHSKHENNPARLPRLPIFLNTLLWRLGINNLSWLFEDLMTRHLVDDRRVALSMIFRILNENGQLETELDRLRKLVANCSQLQEDLKTYLTPPSEDAATLRMERATTHQRRRAKKEQQAKNSWIEFREALQGDVSPLYSPVALGTWVGVSKLLNLTEWLIHRTQESSYQKAALAWRLLEKGFGYPIAEAYREGMKVLWRITKPERPQHQPGGGVTPILSFAGLAVEAAENPDWVSQLSDQEVEQATRHGCMAEEGYPDWIDRLVIDRPHVVLPVLRKALASEWKSSHKGRSDFLYHYANSTLPIHPAVQELLIETIAGEEPDNLDILDKGLLILQRLDLSDKDSRRLATLARRRLHRHTAAGRSDHALRYLALLFLATTNSAASELAAWLDTIEEEHRTEQAGRAFSLMFDWHDPLIVNVLDRMHPEALELLVRLAFRYIRPEDDVVHEGVYTPGPREHAEGARGAVLKALLERPGVEAYRAVLALTKDKNFSSMAIRFQELARAKAERDAESPPWSAADVLNLERRHTAVVKTGADLLRVVMAVLDDIRHEFKNADFSSLPVLTSAKDEDAAQNWLADQLKLRAHGRYHVAREVEVAERNEPDIIVASTAAPCEVAIEVKHANQKWTVRQLDHSLKRQLAADYLRPTSRQHGIFVITLHKQRMWRHPETNAPMSFDDFIGHLSDTASHLDMNTTGPIDVRVVGIDASSH